MPFILTSVFIFPICLVVGYLLKQKAIRVLPLSLMAIIVFQYVMGLFGFLAAGVWVIRLVWVIACAYLVYVLATKKLPIKTSALEIIPVALVLAAMWWICRGRVFLAWDEFSHWGIAIKGMFYENLLPSVTSLTDSFKSYPPSTAILQHAIMKTVNLPYREDIVIYIQSLFTASLLMYPLAFVKGFWRKACVFVTMLLVPIMLFKFFYTEIMMDAILGLMLAFILLIYYFGSKSKFDITLMSMAAFVLCLIKSTGILFAVFAVVIIAVDLCLSKGFKNLKRLDIFIFAAPLVSALVAKFSWSIHLAIMQVPKLWQTPSLSVKSILDLVFNGEPQYRVQTIQNFCFRIFTDYAYGFLMIFSYAFYFVIFVALFFIVKKFIPSEKAKAFTNIFYSIFTVGILYTVFTLGAYLFAFSEYEAVRVASIWRYLNTYLIAMLVFFAAQTVFVLQNADIKKIVACMLSVLFAVFMFANSNPITSINNIVFAPNAAAQSLLENKRIVKVYKQAAQDILALPEGSVPRVKLINQGDEGYTNMRMIYELAPQKLNINSPASIYQTPFSEDDIWSAYYTPEDLQKELYENYDYVYIMYIKDEFLKDYSSLFENPNNIPHCSMYKVEKNKDKTVTLVYQSPTK